MPAAIEMMDALAIEAAEAAVHCNYPEGAGAVLVIELDGPAVEVEQEYAEVERLCHENGAFEQRLATDPAERALIWKGRKSAFAAVGRISPDYIVQDGVIPRTALPEVLHRDRRAVRRRPASGSPTSSTPATATCTRWCCSTTPSRAPASAAEEVSGAILDLCIEHGGSITGEHGVGMDKAKYMPRMYTDDDLDTMQLVRCAFDPDDISNPGKVFPTPRLCGEVPGRHKGAHPLQEAGLAEVVLMATTLDRTAREASPPLRGRARRRARPTPSTASPRPGRPARRHRRGRRGAARRGRARADRRAARPRHQAVLGRRRRRAPTCCSTSARLDRVLDHAAGDLIVAAQAGARLADVQEVVGRGRPAARPRRDRARRHDRRHARHQRQRPAPASRPAPPATC